MTRAIILALCLAAAPAAAHEIHNGQQHVNYSGWVNQDGRGCCNNRDCRPIKDDDVRMSPRIMVRIEGEWCPVLPKRYLSAGNAPNWQSNHVCVAFKTDATGPCERLLCFQPKPLF